MHAIFPIFLRFFTLASKTVFASGKAGPEIIENGLLAKVWWVKETINGGFYGANQKARIALSEVENLIYLVIN